MSQSTLDSICRGELLLEQPKDGYRFNVDSVILADFVFRSVASPPQSVVDLGAGCGIIGLLLARRWPECSVFLVELQPALAELAKANVVRNHLEHRVHVCCADLRELTWIRNEPQVIVSNPPFFELAKGRPSPNPEIALAKHELSCRLDQLLQAAGQGLSAGGQLFLIHALGRLEEIFVKLEQHRLHPTSYRKIQPLPNRPCSRVLIQAAAQACGDTEEAPALLIEQQPGSYSDEMLRVLAEE